MPLSGEKTGSVSPSLPDYLLQKENRVKNYRSTAFAAFEQEMDMSIKNMKGWNAQLRLCQDTIEGSVLALGVSTSYDLLKRIQEVQEGLQVIQGKWAKVVNARREENRLQDELYEGCCGAFATMREKSEQLEREVKTMIQERDRRDESLDNAIQYVHAVIAERAAWQEKFGYNSLELPMEELTFSERSTAALSALYHARRVQMMCDSEHSFEDGPLGNPCLQKVPIRRPAVSLVDDAKTIGRRWKEIEDVRQSMASFSCRLKYIPPMEEITLLREVLEMGTGTRTLMRDIESERQRLTKAQEDAVKECFALRRSLAEVKEELFLLKCFLRESTERRAPFMNQVPALVKVLFRHIEVEALAIAKQWELERELDREEEKKVGVMNNAYWFGHDANNSNLRRIHNGLNASPRNAPSIFLSQQPSMFSITDGENFSHSPISRVVVQEGIGNNLITSEKRKSAEGKREGNPLSPLFTLATSFGGLKSKENSFLSTMGEKRKEKSEVRSRTHIGGQVEEGGYELADIITPHEQSRSRDEAMLVPAQPQLSNSPKKLP